MEAGMADSQECSVSVGARMQDKLVSVKEASERIAVSTFTTRRLVKARQLRAVRVGKRLLIPQSEIERVIAGGVGKYAQGAPQ